MSYMWTLAVFSAGYCLGTAYGSKYPLVINQEGVKIGETHVIKSEDNSIKIFGIPVIKSKKPDTKSNYSLFGYPKE